MRRSWRSCWRCRWPSSRHFAPAGPADIAHPRRLPGRPLHAGLLSRAGAADDLRRPSALVSGRRLRRHFGRAALSPFPAGADAGVQPLRRADAQPARLGHRGAAGGLCGLRPGQGPAAAHRAAAPRAAQRADLDGDAASASTSARCWVAPSSPRRSSPSPASAG